MKNSIVKEHIERLINIHGVQYYPAALPEDISRGEVGDCFDHCLIQALHHPKYQYVEGVAKVYHHGKKTDWVLHSWLTDGQQAYDPTWLAEGSDGKEYPMPAYYIGIAMPTKAVAAFVSNTGYKSVLANYWRNEELSQQCFRLKFGVPA